MKRAFTLRSLSRSRSRDYDGSMQILRSALIRSVVVSALLALISFTTLSQSGALESRGGYELLGSSIFRPEVPRICLMDRCERLERSPDLCLMHNDRWLPPWMPPCAPPRWQIRLLRRLSVTSWPIRPGHPL
jgi:hypothetical protein